MLFISERIKNISNLETYIENARMYFSILEEELNKSTPSREVIDSAAFEVKKSLHQAKNFGFVLEKRKCEIKDVSESPKFLENLRGEDNVD